MKCLFLKITIKETLNLIKRYRVLSAAVIEIGMYRIRQDQQFFVVCEFAVLHHVGIKTARYYFIRIILS